MKTFLPSFTSILILFSGCSEDSSVRPDYFPFEKGQRFIYNQYAAETPEDFSSQLAENKIVEVIGDTVYEGYTYTLLAGDECLVKAVREENGSYYERAHWGCYYSYFAEETKFLDANKVTGATWDDFIEEGNLKISSIIRDRIPVRKFQDKTYENIIVVERQYFHTTYDGGWEFWRSSWHYYAAGYGKIYSFSSYPLTMADPNTASLLVKIE